MFPPSNPTLLDKSPSITDNLPKPSTTAHNLPIKRDGNPVNLPSTAAVSPISSRKQTLPSTPRSALGKYMVSQPDVDDNSLDLSKSDTLPYNPPPDSPREDTSLNDRTIWAIPTTFHYAFANLPGGIPGIPEPTKLSNTTDRADGKERVQDMILAKMQKIDALSDLITQFQSQAVTITVQAEQIKKLEAQVAASRAKTASFRAKIAALRNQVATLQVQIAALRASADPPAM